MTCAPPPDCAGRTDGACAPPPWCARQGDKYACKPPEHAGPSGAPNQPPPCKPGPDGQLVCAPPPECGGSAYGGAGAAGCAPPDFCSKGADGNYVCKPPQDCRADGRCFAAAAGAACEREMQSVAASGAFVPCAAPPTQLCPPPPPNAAPDWKPACGAPPPPPRFCAPGETPPGCIPPPSVDSNGRYVTPGEHLKGDCAPPPAGEWPPAQPAPAGKVWCPPMGFAPPPRGADVKAWQSFAKDHAPPELADFLSQQGGSWAKLGDAQLEALHNAATAHQLFAPPSFDGRYVNGSFARGTLGEDLAMRDFAVGGAAFFREARPLVDATSEFSTAAGPTVLASGGRVAVESHNTPTGLLAYKATEGAYDVEFRPEDGFTLSQEGGLTLLKSGDWTGVLVGDASIVDGAIRVGVDASNPAFFMAIPPGGLEEETRLDIAQGVADGKVFAEVALVERDGSIAQDLALYEDASAFKLDVTDAGEDAINLTVSGEGEGQALVLTVDRSTLTTPLSEFAVTIDGKEMTECASFDELTASASDGGCFTLDANETTLRVSVMPEHFSTHAISLGAMKAAAEPTKAISSPTADAGSPDPARAAEDAAATISPPAADKDAAAAPAEDAAPPAGKATPGVGVAGVVGVALVVVAALSRRRQR